MYYNERSFVSVNTFVQHLKMFY